jgi:hypothetical protein
MTTEIIISVISIILSGIISSVITISVQKSITKRETDHRLFLKKVDIYQEFIKSIIDFLISPDLEPLEKSYKKMTETIILYGKTNLILEWNLIWKKIRLDNSDNIENVGNLLKAIRKDLGYNENIDGLDILKIVANKEIPKK